MPVQTTMRPKDYFASVYDAYGNASIAAIGLPILSNSQLGSALPDQISGFNAPQSVSDGQIHSDVEMIRAAIRSGQTDYNTGTGFWLGTQSGTAKFSIGSSTGSRLTWDGSSLSIVGVSSISATYTAGEALSAGDAIVPLSYPAADVAYDTSASGGPTNASSGSPISASFAVTAGNSNRLLVVLTASYGAAIGTAIASVKYNNVSMVEQGIDANNGNFGSFVGERLQIWTLAAPATGSNTLLITPSGATTRSVDYAVYSFYNVNTSAVLTGDSHTSGSPAAINLTGTPSINGSVCFGGMKGSLNATTTIVNNIISIDTNTFKGGWCDAIYPTSTRTLNLNSAGNAAVILEMTPIQTAATQRVYKTKATILERTTGFIGFAAEAISSGSSGSIAVSGVVTGLTSLALGTQYYLSDTAGALSSSAGTNTRKAAIGLSTTSVVITNIW